MPNDRPEVYEDEPDEEEPVTGEPIGKPKMPPIKLPDPVPHEPNPEVQ